jgi:hypothetical protein
MTASTLPVPPPYAPAETDRTVFSPATGLYLVPGGRPAVKADATVVWLVTALAAVGICIHGYHPYAEDAGLYLPGIKRLLHHDLYPQLTDFVTAQSRFSIFATAISGLISLSHFRVMTVMFMLYCATTWLTLFALDANYISNFYCPYKNSAMKVCALPRT